jgi:hypothetical protein
MKAIKVAEFDIIKCGVEFVTGRDSRPGVEELLPHMERKENYVYWMQPKGGSTEQQQACIHVNGTYYALNNKLEKAIFRNVRLTRDFKNYERLVDGTRKLVIPQRLFQEKLRTSNRVPSVFPVSARRFRLCARLRDSLSNPRTDKTLFTQNNSMQRKSKSKPPGLEPTPADAKDAAVGTQEAGCPNESSSSAPAADTVSENKRESKAYKEPPKRPRKTKGGLNLHSIMEGFKRRKLTFEVSDVLSECADCMSMEDTPLIQTPRTFFKSLCGVFELEFPGMLSEAAIQTAVSALDDTQ